MAYQYEEFKRDVYKLTDINLDLYKERQMKRRIESLIARKGFDGFESFYKGMKQDEGLLRTFVSYLTINVSQFYRNPQQWMNFDQEIIPYLRKKYGDTLTIWSAACSTGDEPYTIAMILSEYIPLSKIRIIATDLDEDVLAFAKEGVYPAKSLSDLPKKYLDKHFKKVDDSHYAISPEIKKCVEFKKHNLLKDRYFQHIHKKLKRCGIARAYCFSVYKTAIWIIRVWQANTKRIEMCFVIACTADYIIMYRKLFFVIVHVRCDKFFND